MKDAGRIGFLIRGEYSDNESYGFLDVVYYKGSSYAAQKDTIGNEPLEDSEYWQMIAKGSIEELGYDETMAILNAESEVA